MNEEKFKVTLQDTEKTTTVEIDAWSYIDENFNTIIDAFRWHYGYDSKKITEYMVEWIEVYDEDFFKNLHSDKNERCVCEGKDCCLN